MTDLRNYLFNKKQNYRVSFKVPVKDRTYYIVDFQHKDIKARKKGVFQLYRSGGRANICGDNLSDSYLKAILTEIDKDIYDESYKRFVLLTEWQYQDYKRYLEGDEVSIFPLGILIIRMDKQYIHISTVCKNPFPLLNTKEEAKRIAEFVNASVFVPVPYDQEFTNRLDFTLRRFRHQSPNFEKLNYNRFIEDFKEVVLDNKTNMDNQKTKSKKKQLIRKKMEPIADNYSIEIFGKKQDDFLDFIDDEVINLISVHLDMKTKNLTKEEVNMYKNTLLDLFRDQVGGGLDYKKIQKYYGINETDPKREDKIADMKRPLLSTTNQLFDFVLGMSKQIGYNGVSLDSVPNDIPYNIYKKARKFKLHNKPLKADYRHEGYEPLIPMVKEITDGTHKVEFNFRFDLKSKDIIKNNGRGLIEMGCKLNDKTYTCSNVIDDSKAMEVDEEEEDIDIQGLEISSPKSLSIKSNKPKVKLDMSMPINVSKPQQKNNLSISTPQHISKASKPKPSLELSSPQYISKASKPKPSLEISSPKQIIMPSQQRGCVGRFCDQVSDMVYGVFQRPQRNKLKRRRSEDELDLGMPQEKRQRLNNPVPRDILLRAKPISQQEFERNRTQPVNKNQVMFGTLQNGGKRIYLMVKSGGRTKKLNKGKK